MTETQAPAVHALAETGAGRPDRNEVGEMAQPLGRCPRQQVSCRQHENARSADRKENELKGDMRLNVVRNDVERGSEAERSDRAEDIYDREIDREDAEILRRIEPGQHGDGGDDREPGA